MVAYSSGAALLRFVERPDHLPPLAKNSRVDAVSDDASWSACWASHSARSASAARVPGSRRGIAASFWSFLPGWLYTSKGKPKQTKYHLGGDDEDF